MLKDRRLAGNQPIHYALFGGLIIWALSVGPAAAWVQQGRLYGIRGCNE